jgi:D-sedoheptulose 7-phosphate isomerase
MNNTANIFSEEISYHVELVNKFKEKGFAAIEQIVDCLSACFDNGGKVLLMGNGGSAADCQHIAGELVGRFKINRSALPAISLACDTAVLTCISNDFDYESVFSRQVKALAEPQDLLWAISTSGSSSNVLKAVKWANEREITVISFTGKKDSPLEEISDICLCAGTPKTAQAQQIHQISYHIICGYLDQIYDNDSNI